jgi:hypothetical protein
VNDIIDELVVSHAGPWDIYWGLPVDEEGQTKGSPELGGE